MKEKHWILESAILIALGTGILYSFGHYYDYRLRFEFDIHTIALGVSPETLIHDGATVMIAWFGSTKEFWVSLPLLALIIVLNVSLKRKFQNINKPANVLVTWIVCLIILYSSIVSYIPSRAQQISTAIEKLALLKRQSLYFDSGEVNLGYTIIGTPTKLAFLTSDNIVLVFHHTEVNRIVSSR